MGKGRRSAEAGEQRENQRLKAENQKLKKQISSLRKQMSRIDVDRYSNIKDLLDAHDLEDNNFDSKTALEDLKRKWECHVCKDGFLKLIILSKTGVPYYFRKCSSCDNKTKLKLYDDTIEGIKE